MNLKDLSKPLPKEAIKQHPTKTYLSSIKAIYVTERFNDVFGVGEWTQKVETEHVNHDTGMVIVKVIFEVPAKSIYYESFGGNDNGGTNNKNFDLGDAYKGATTDALTKIGSYLGVAIDVFKGKHDKSAPNGQPQDNKKWLNDNSKEWQNVALAIDNGKITNIDQVSKIYKISKELRSKLELLIK